ncbi:hypothetical protein PGN83_06055 [Klebsiella aerogenes]|uniref:hypothetical protein n=1 Tax=Klebsiella TaxID=570 RepID=UPI00254E4837|nr:hypothetical protein [Klebsiella aerogenes]EKW1036072.1 hypothetical protein [Klebsiella aerogenes]MEC5623276.1 hypothetical protein [Klebsiella aerogenes]
MNKIVTLIYASGATKKVSVPDNVTSVTIPSDKSTYPPEDTQAQIEQLAHEEKIYWFARESQDAISFDRVKCILLNIV